eukprot:TRINITY_DN111467_c0_g1_i1.p2 TRINITY_DN111467_c0_g1~~TRINITY_DN111467_c0_g1_i1.p2  ORF type:complete len:230 (+),score=69.22 TRINITY_DN111467_c0_g1_i1:60-749(+)
MVSPGMAERRPARQLRLPAFLACAAAAVLCSSGISFVGTPTEASARGDRVAMNSKVTRNEGYRRRAAGLAVRQKMVTLEDGREVSLDYKHRLRSKTRDPAFAAAAATGDSKKVTFEMRPFGILRYQPGKANKGAMVMSVSSGFYTDDPQGQARDAGVTPGMVVTKIAGQDVTGKDFLEVMQLLGDENLGEWEEGRMAGTWRAHESWESKAKPCPLEVEFASIPNFPAVK